MSDRRVLGRRMAAYSTLPLLSALTPFLVLPIISRASGTTEWSALAVGQSIGLLATLVVGFGWPVLGPPKVAQSDRRRQRELYAASLTSRAVVFAVAGPVVVGIALLASPGGGTARALCALMAFAGALTGFSIAWFCIGTGRPGMIARYEVAPRVVLSVAAALAVLWTGLLWLYPIGICMGVLSGVVAFSRRILRGRDAAREPTLRVLRRQVAATLVEVSAGSYTMGGAFLTGLVATPRQVAEFGSGDRLNQVSLQGIVAISNALNPWVAESHGRSFARRARVSLVVHAGVGVAGLVVIAVAGPWLSALLFSERHAVSPGTCLAFGVYFCAVSMQTALARHVLVSRRKVRPVLVATLFGAAIGVPAVIIGASTQGSTGAASGLALGEVMICLLLALPAARVIHEHRVGTLADRTSGKVTP